MSAEPSTAVSADTRLLSASATFAQAADHVLESIGPRWATPGTLSTWRRAMTLYAAPFRDKPLDAVSEEDIASALAPIWTTKPALAAKIRKLWEQVLDQPTAGSPGPRSNPARWSPSLRNRLRPQSKRAGTRVAVDDLPWMVEHLRSGRGYARVALQVSVATCVGAAPICGLRWENLSQSEDGWTMAVAVGAGRAGAGPTVGWRTAPLCDVLIEALAQVAPLRSRSEGYVFAPSGADEPLRADGIALLSRRLFGVQAWRLEPLAVEAAFRTWALRRQGGAVAPRPGFRVAVVDDALAVVPIGTGTGGPGLGDVRSDQRALFEAWAAFLYGVQP